MLTTFNEFGKDLATFEACFLFLITKVYNWVAKRNLNLVAALDFLILTHCASLLRACCKN